MEFNIADLFECVADAVPGREAVVCGEVRRTYAELDERATRLALDPAAAGVETGAHVGLYLRNSVAHLEAMIACYKARVVPINVNYRYVTEELRYLCDDADLVALFHDAETAEHVDAVRSPALRLVVVAGSDEYEQLVRAGSPQRDLGPRSPDDRYVLYTGGTTGRPKGVVWRQEDMFFGGLGSGNPGGPPITAPEEIAASVLDNPAQRLRAFLPPGDTSVTQFVSLALGPLMHASGQWSALGTVLGGGKVVLYGEPHVNMALVLDLIERERVNACNLVGDASARPMLDALLAQPGHWDLTALRLLGSGGSIMSGEVKDGLMAALPSVLAIVEGIGSSESPAQAVALTTRSGVPSASLTFSTKAETIVVDDDLRPVRARRRCGRPPRNPRTACRSATTRIPNAAHARSWRSTASGGRSRATWRRSTPTAPCTCSAAARCASIPAARRCTPKRSKPFSRSTPISPTPSCSAHPTNGSANAWSRSSQWQAGTTRPTSSRSKIIAARLAGYKVPRGLHVVDEISRTPAGKVDYAWARAITGS